MEFGHEIEPPLDQVAPDRRQSGQRAERRLIHALGAPRLKSLEEPRPCVLARARGKSCRRASVASSGSDVTCSPPSATYAPRRAVVVRDAIRAVRRGDVDLDHHQIRRVVEVERLDVLVLNLDLVVVARGTRPASPGRAAGTAST